MDKKVVKAVKYAVDIANDDSHGYDQSNRWGNPDYDCSALIIDAFEHAGIKVKEAGASYTGDMKAAFKKAGFKDVTKSVNLKTGEGLEEGDVLLKEGNHTALYIGGGKLVQASINEKGTTKGGKKGDQTGREIWVTKYYNYPWNCVLRYGNDTEKKPAPAAVEKKIVVTGGSVNVRKGGGVDYPVICVVHKDAILDYDGTKQNGWYHVKVDGKAGYISNKYSKEVTAPVFNKKVVVTSGSVNVRNGGGVNYPILFVVHKDDILEYDGTKQNGWYHVKVDGKTGYINPNYVKEK